MHNALLIKTLNSSVKFSYSYFVQVEFQASCNMTMMYVAAAIINPTVAHITVSCCCATCERFYIIICTGISNGEEANKCVVVVLLASYPDPREIIRKGPGLTCHIFCMC